LIFLTGRGHGHLQIMPFALFRLNLLLKGLLKKVFLLNVFARAKKFPQKQ